MKRNTFQLSSSKFTQLTRNNMDLLISHSPQATSMLQEWTTEPSLSDRLFRPNASTRSSDPQSETDHLFSTVGCPVCPKSVRSSIVPHAPASLDDKSSEIASHSALSEAFQSICSIHNLSGSTDTSAASLTDSSTIQTSSVTDDTDIMPFQGTVQLVLDSDTIDRTTLPTPTFRCRFSFLNCTYASTDEFEWKQHNLSHFRGQVPPQSNVCPLCDMTFQIPDPNVSWAAHMSHIAQHLKDGMSYAAARPDFGLFKHLWNKRLICDMDYQELIKHQRLSPNRQPYIVHERRDRRERRGIPVPQSNL